MVLTLWQPWASLVLAGAKPYEFRSWRAPRGLVGKRIGIHAGARKPSVVEVVDLVGKLRGAQWRYCGLERKVALPLLIEWRNNLSVLPRGSILCTAVLGEPIRNVDLATALGVEAVNDSDRDEHSNWGWPLHDIEPCTPMIPVRGYQGLWPYSGEIR